MQWDHPDGRRQRPQRVPVHLDRLGGPPRNPSASQSVTALSTDLPELPETVVHANHWHFFRHFLRDARPACTPEETDRYIEAWSQPGAAAGMINYYRSSVRTPPKQAEAALRPIKAPTLVIWGQGDRYLGEELAEPEHDDVPNLDRVERLPGASHWVHHDEPERVNQLLSDFFAPALPVKN
jgi:pimeloyl-ACP methyl ester carboxylesterase